MKKIKSFQEWDSMNEGLWNLLFGSKKNKKEKGERKSKNIHLNGYIILPEWDGKKNVKIESTNIYPSLNKSKIEFRVGKNNIDHIVFHSKDKDSRSVSVYKGGKAKELTLDKSEADRIRKQYLS